MPKAKGVLRACAVVSGLAAMLWCSALAALWVWQEHLLFRPVPLLPAEQLTIEPDVRERLVDVPGARLSVLELRRPDPAGVVFFLHGNSGNLKSWFINGDMYRQANLELVMMDYRGFGKSSGRITSEAQLHADVEAVWQAVSSRYQGRRVIVLGRSLGTGLAAAWAARHQPQLTILVSPYSSMRDLAAEHYPWVPQAVLRYPLRSDQAVAQIQTPVLLVHGDQDRLISPAHSLALSRKTPHARRVLIPGAGHADLQDFPLYEATLREALSAQPRR